VPVALNPVRAALDKSVTPYFSQEYAVPLARLYDRHAEDCARAAEQTNDPRDRAMFIKLVDEWRKAAQELRLQHPSP
jgi:hypothetical protein